MEIDRLESLIFDRMAASRLPGLSLAVVKDGRTVYARGLGLRDIPAGRPATPRTLYGIGSVTKSFTALAIMQLAEQGLLDPDDPVERHVPFPWRPFGETVRLRHLLSHSSGIPALAYSEALISHYNGTGGRWLPISGPDDILTFMQGCEEWVESRPGERYAYFNEGYAILGLIIEKLSGLSYNDYIRERITGPLGMERSFLERERVEADDDVAVPYVLPTGEQPRPGHYLYRTIRSEGGLISSVLDLTEYLRMYLEGGRGIVSPSGLEAMTTSHVGTPYAGRPGLDRGDDGRTHPVGYGYGLAIEEFMGRRLVGHAGSLLVSTAFVAFMPEENLGVAVLMNGTGWSSSLFAKAALAVFLGRSPEDVPQIRLENALAALCGNYHAFRRTIEARVERQGDFLRLRLSGGEESILVPESIGGGEEEVFHTLVEGMALRVTFRHVDGGVELVFGRYKLRRTGTP